MVLVTPVHKRPSFGVVRSLPTLWPHRRERVHMQAARARQKGQRRRKFSSSEASAFRARIAPLRVTVRARPDRLRYRSNGPFLDGFRVLDDAVAGHPEMGRSVGNVRFVGSVPKQNDSEEY